MLFEPHPNLMMRIFMSESKLFFATPPPMGWDRVQPPGAKKAAGWGKGRWLAHPLPISPY